MTQVIAFMGAKRSGKDTVASIIAGLAQSVPLNTEKLAFADPLREMMYLLNPIVQNDGTRYAKLVDDVGYEEAKSNAEVRRLLQHFGTEVVRGVLGDSTWVDHLDRRVQQTSADIVLVTDLRFPNEYEIIRSMPGSTIVRVDRPDVEDAGADSHASETAWLDLVPDFQIMNAGSIQDLYDAVEELWHKVVVSPAYV